MSARREAQALGKTWNPVSREVWQDVRLAWASLAPERQRRHQECAAADKFIAKVARLNPASPGQLSLESRPRGPRSNETQTALVPVETAKVVDPSGKDVSIVLVGQSQPTVLAIPQVDVDDEIPMKVAVFEAAMTGRTLATVKEEFQKKSNVVVPAGAFPSVVDYGDRCKGICCKRHLSLHLKMQDLLLEDFAVHFFPKAVDQDVLLACEVFAQEGERRATKAECVIFCLLVSAACRFGRHPARQELGHYNRVNLAASLRS